MGKVRIDPKLGQKIKAAAMDSIARDMLRRGKRVEAAAKVRISGHPKRVDSGRLRDSIKAVPIRKRGAPGARIGTKVKYAMLVHDGTGIYGPRGMRIRPKTKKYLRFIPKGGNRFVFARSVKGMRPNPFLRDALVAARG
jgi:hypothetical protein